MRHSHYTNKKIMKDGKSLARDTSAVYGAKKQIKMLPTLRKKIVLEKNRCVAKFESADLQRK